MNSKSLIRNIALLTFFAVVSFMTSCVREEMPECSLYVQFKYDYNMLFTDAFYTQVDKVELYVFDKDGKFLFRQTEEGDALATGNYRMEVKLPVGEYQFLAWAGAHNSYDIASAKGESDITEMKLKLKREQSRIIDKELEPLWHGGINHVEFTGKTNQTEVISLIKNTNKVRFVFQGYSQGKADNSPSGTWNLNVDDYSYEIVESNGYMAYDNSLLDDDALSYRPEEQKNTSAAVVELNTMRLMEDRHTRFTVTEKATGKKVFDINLIDYLAMTAMEGYSRKVQEYLDREDEYKIVFFFADSSSSSDLWQALQIQINGWTWYLQTEGGM